MTSSRMSNKKIPASINRWSVEHNPYGFLQNENWLKEAERTEDILQLSHIDKKDLVLDVGFYKNVYKVYVIYREDWEHPEATFQSKDAEPVAEQVYQWIDEYAAE